MSGYATNAPSELDLRLMREALGLAELGRGAVSPNPMVGAVVSREGEVVGRGHHARAGEPHAEVHALREAGERARGATLHCTLEPCAHEGRTPPCVGAILAAGVARVVVAARDPNPVAAGGVERLREAGVEVVEGVLRGEARRQNEFFFVYHEKRRPFVTLKWAMTLDGRTGTDSNHSRWISGEASRRHVHRLRADHDAILIGIGTVLADDPMLNVRLEGYEGRQPMRIVVDGDLSIPRRARMLRERDAGPVLIATTEHAREEDVRALEGEGVRVVRLPGHRRLVHMGPLMEVLHAERVLSVFCEGGRQLETSLLAARAADKIVAYVSPKIVGGRELRSPVEDLGFATMDEAIVLQRPRWTGFDEDMCLEGYLEDPGW